MCQREWRRARVQAQRLADLARLRRVRDRIDRHYAQPLNVEVLAGEVNMSAGHLSRQFRAAYGETLYAYLMTRRIERAAALLRRGDLSVTEVCFAVGCGSLGTFTTRFTELVGMPPGAFRRQTADAAAGPADAGGAARAAGAAMAVEGMPACVAKHVARPVRNREAVVAGQRLA
ncbi:helix-turn-helix transcriptional regulator [Streptomyces lydicus]|uniref:helix-turn-helix transcriptional regulator n=1 Tax=Streptomyces lydicus TaxID=47763 RepID=UPI0036C134C5